MAQQNPGVPDYALGFTTLKTESDLAALPVEGRIPDWLDGCLYRTGSAGFEIGGEHLRHQFDGLAMLYRFDFRDGKISFRNRYVNSRGKLYAEAKGKVGLRTWATRAAKSDCKEAERMFPDAPDSNPGVALAQIDGQLVTMTDGSTIPAIVDRETLDTLGEMKFDDALATKDVLGRKGNERRRLTTAHAQLCTFSGRIYNYFVEFGLRPTYNIYWIEPGTRVRRPLASVQTDAASNMHSFGITERYIILPESPSRISLFRLAIGKSASDAVYWNKNAPMRFHIISKADGKLVRTVEAPPHYIVHMLNCWEDGDSVVMEYGAYEDESHTRHLAFDPSIRGDGSDQRFPRLHERSVHWRVVLPLTSGDARIDVVQPESIELGTIDYSRLNGRRHKVAYAASMNRDRHSGFYDQLVRLDNELGGTKLWREPGHFPGEAIFVHKPGARDPNDGVCISMVLDSAAGTSYLAVLDALSFETVGRAVLPHHVPFALHGLFEARK